MFVSHAKVRIVGLGGRSRKRRPHRRRLGLREMAGMPCLIPTALTVLLGLLAVAFGAGLALLGYLPTMDALVEVDHNVSISGLSRNPNVPSSTTRSIASSTPNPSGTVAGSGSNDNLKNSIVFNSSAISSQTSITSDSSGPSFQTTGPKYSQLSVSAVPTHYTHRPKHHQRGGLKHHHHDAGDKSPDGILTATASFTTTASPGEGGVGVYVRRQRSSGGRLLALRACSYAGPVVMAIGMFAMIMACVFYCELLDKYAILVPDKGHGPGVQKDELYQIIIQEMKKSYAQTLITAYTKAAERSLLVHEPARSAEVGAGTACEANANGEEQTQQQHLPDPLVPYNPLEPLSLEQQIDIECEGYTPSPPIPNKRYSVIQARIQRLRSEDNWLKTSSLPNIRRSISIKRAGRMGSKIAENPRTLSYDYTMDEARLRRKSMMLRSIVQWNSGSSGDLVAQQAQAARALHQRRFSSAKALQTQPDDSLDELFQEQSHGSFPLTRLIQRRGTFACGDMRTRRMKFLILLQASESNEVFQQQQQQQQQHHRRQSTYPHSKHHHDNVSVDSRSASRFSGIRRNSFIPYNTCDKFITTEERRSARNSRRPSINPFAPRLAQQYAQPERSAIRRHSFFPIRREDKIFESDPLEQRRHSFNPIGVNNTLKSEYAGGAASGVYDRRGSFNPDSRRGSFNPDSRRGSFNPDSRRGSFNPDSRRGSFNPDSRRGSFAPPPSSAGQQKSPRFLQVPGFEHEFHMERRPSGDSSGSETGASSHLLSPPMHQVDPSPYTYLPRPTGKHYHFGVTSPVLESQAERQAVERRHSFNPVVRVSAAGPDSDGAAASRGPPNVPLIVVNADTSGRFLTVPSEDSEQRMVGGGMGPDSLEVRRHSFNTAPQSAYLASHNANPTLERPVPQRNISFRLDPSGLEGSPTSYPTSQASSTSVTPSKQFAKRSSLKYKPQGYSPSDAAAATAVRPSSFNQEMVLFQPLALVESRGTSPSSNLSYCGSERVGSERSPKASRTTSISSDYSAVTTSVYADDTLRQPLRPGESDNGFRPVSPAGHPPVYHYLPGDPRSRNFGVYDDDMTESNQYTDLSYSTHSAYQPSGGIRRCASFRESRTQPLQHIRTDSTGSADSGPATLSPSLSTNANVPIHRSRSAGSLPGERGIPRRDGDIRNLRALPRRWDDTRYTQQEARRLAEERYSTRPSPPQSPLFRPYSYASWRVPKPPSPLVGKHWPPSKHDTDSNSS